MTKRILTALALSLLAVFGSVATADAKKRKPVPTPTIKSIAPLEAEVGDRLVIRGTNFIPGDRKTRVFFLRSGGGAVFARSDSGSKTRLVVTIPDSVIPLLRHSGTEYKPTRFQLRILAKKFGKASAKSKSPIISAPALGTPGGGGTPDPGVAVDGDCDHDGVTNGNEVDDDNDLLNDDLEANSSHTDACDADTDGDGIEDGYEYESALDLNARPTPYPGKRPYPNPLDADAGTDYDGDGLDLIDEYALWRRYGGHVFPLNYSDGTQHTAPIAAPGDIEHAYMDMDGDGLLSDDEKDADGDELGNWDELYGRMTQNWWDKTFSKDPFNEKRYPLEYLQVSHIDPDTDGDGVSDGLDDQDHDGYTNRFEIERPSGWGLTYVSLGWNTPSPDPENSPLVSGSQPFARVQPFNPCKPLYSPKCHLHPPFDYYGDDEDWASIHPRGSVPTPTWPGGYTAP